MLPKFLEFLKRYSFPIFVVIIAVVAVWYHRFEVRQFQDLERQLRGELTEKEKILQTLNVELGITKSSLVSSDALKKLEKNLIDKDSAFEAFKKEQHLLVMSLTQAMFKLEQKIKGTSTATVDGPNPNPIPDCPDCPKCIDGTKPCDPKDFVIKYAYDDEYRRFHLETPNIWDKDAATMTTNQQFRLTGEVLKQENGNLQTERLILEEMVKDEGGKLKSVGKAALTDAQFSYTTVPAKDSILDLSIFAEVGTAFQDVPLNFGAGVNILRWKWVGLAADMLTDFKSWSGTGLGVQASFRPKIGSRYINVGANAGVAVPFGGETRVRPYVGATFYVY